MHCGPNAVEAEAGGNVSSLGCAGSYRQRGPRRDEPGEPYEAHGGDYAGRQERGGRPLQVVIDDSPECYRGRGSQGL